MSEEYFERILKEVAVLSGHHPDVIRILWELQTGQSKQKRAFPRGLPIDPFLFIEKAEKRNIEPHRVSAILKDIIFGM